MNNIQPDNYKIILHWSRYIMKVRKMNIREQLPSGAYGEVYELETWQWWQGTIEHSPRHETTFYDGLRPV